MRARVPPKSFATPFETRPTTSLRKPSAASTAVGDPRSGESQSRTLGGTRPIRIRVPREVNARHSGRVRLEWSCAHSNTGVSDTLRLARCFDSLSSPRADDPYHPDRRTSPKDRCVAADEPDDWFGAPASLPTAQGPSDTIGPGAILEQSGWLSKASEWWWLPLAPALGRRL